MGAKVGDISPLRAALQEHQLLCERFPSQGCLYRLLTSNQSNTVHSFPRAKQLVDCIRIWSDCGIWELISHIQKNFPYFAAWNRLQKRQHEWLEVKDSLLNAMARHTTPAELDYKDIITKIRSIILFATAYSIALLKILKLLNDDSTKHFLAMNPDLGHFLEHEYYVRDQLFAKSEGLLLYLKRELASWEREIDDRGERIQNTFVRVMEERSDSGSCSYEHRKIMKELIGDILEGIMGEEKIMTEDDLLWKSFDRPRNEEHVHSKIMKEIQGEDYLFWESIIEVAERMFNVGTKDKSSISDALIFVNGALRDTASRLAGGIRKKNPKSEAFDSLMGFIKPGAYYSMASTDVSNIVGAICDLSNDFECPYTEARKNYKATLELEVEDYLCARNNGPTNPAFDLKTMVVGVLLDIPGYLDTEKVARVCQFVQSLMYVLTLFEGERRIMIV
ncbi:hypothetical protein F4677DRAFT_67846 [Hypoxylon crocopeplum]|nr:hypothetical protein F4677DRAFT_67846 [Hypoxylon crocopeplum]